MQFGFEDSGTTTVDTVSGVTLNLVNGANTATDLHGLEGSGVFGRGKALDLRDGVYSSGPLARVTGSTAISLGTITNFTVSLWFKPLNNMWSTAKGIFFDLGAPGTTGDLYYGENNSLLLRCNGDAGYAAHNNQTAMIGRINAQGSSPSDPWLCPMPTNQWVFMAMAYDGTNLSFYRGTETNAVTLVSSTNDPTLLDLAVNVGSSFNVLIGNSGSRTKSALGQMDDVRFYTGAANSNFLEIVRQSMASAVTPVIVSWGGCGAVADLSWSTAPANTGFIIKRSTTPGAETEYATTTESAFVDSNVTVGNTYYYKVSATNTLGVSAESEEVSVTIASTTPVTIVSQPEGQSVCPDSTATFSVTATGSGLTYVWQSSTNQGQTWNAISGATDSSYTTGAVTDTDNDTRFRVLVNSSCGTLQSSVATLLINPAPVITMQPLDQSVPASWGATFAIKTSGPVTGYQWRRNGVNLTDGPGVSGATTPVVRLSNLTGGDSGTTYDCVIGSTCGNVISSNATLTINNDNLELKFGFEEENGFYTYDSVAAVQLDLGDNYGNDFADLHGAPGSGVAGIGKALDFTSGFNGTNGPLAIQSGSATLHSGVTQIGSFTISMWVKPATDLKSGQFYPRFFTLGDRTRATDSGITNTLGMLSDGNSYAPAGTLTAVQGKVNTLATSTTTYGAFDMPVNQWRFVVLTYDGATLNLYGGAENAAVTLQSSADFMAGAIDISNGYKVMLGNRADYLRCFEGQIDDVRFYLGAAPVGELEQIRREASPLTPATTPVFTTSGGCSAMVQLDWASTAGPGGGYIVKRSTVSGAETNYAVTGETEFLDTEVTVGTTYFYKVVATNEISTSAESLETSVEVLSSEPVEITEQPANQEVCSGSTATFTVGLNNDSNVTYTWEVSTDLGETWQEISGATASSYTTEPISPVDDGTQYRVSIGSICGVPVQSSAATLTLSPSPEITTQPLSQTVPTNWGVTFSVKASGPVTGYQWRKNGVDLTDGPGVSGATTAVVKISNLTSEDNGKQFDCVVGGPCSPIISSAATLTIDNDNLQLRFEFEDSGNVTTDSISSVPLNLFSQPGTAADLHGASGSGVGGVGKSLNLSSGVYGTAGPIAIMGEGSTLPGGVSSISSYTITMWIKPTAELATASRYSRFFMLGDKDLTDSTQNKTLALLNNGTRFAGSTSVSATINTSTAPTATFGGFDMPVNQWRFLALTYDGATLNFYGGSEGSPVLLQSTTNFVAGSVDISNGYKLMLGNRPDGIRAFAGEMDDVRFYLGAAPLEALEAIRQEVAPAGPVLISPRINGSDLTLVIETHSGVSYILQSTPSLVNPVWTPVSTNLGTGLSLTNHLPINHGGNEFFRYLIQ